jgi:hypothetical protein
MFRCDTFDELNQFPDETGVKVAGSRYLVSNT